MTLVRSPRPVGSRGVVVVEGGAHDHGRLHGPIKGQGQGERPAGGYAVWIWKGPFPVPSPRIKLALIAFASAIPSLRAERSNPERFARTLACFAPLAMTKQGGLRMPRVKLPIKSGVTKKEKAHACFKTASSPTAAVSACARTPNGGWHKG